ncbi:MAG: hypothetical protein GKR90_21930 [Pseudomonadales bacterium]|nr:hypothetical protein [Pseudomonadales bacterium]
MSTQNIRLSRISHPRGSIWALLLIVIAFLGFGVVAEACLPEATSASMQTSSSVQTVSTIDAVHRDDTAQ